MHWALVAAVLAAWIPDNSKCVFGTVERVRSERITLRTVAGPLELRVPPRLAPPRPGEAVRAYYVYNDGALVTRIEVLATRRPR